MGAEMIPLRLVILASAVALALAVLATGAAWLYVWGKAAAVQEIERANRKAGDAADVGERRVLDCVSPRRWNRETGKCEE